jgi:polysaccharide biosynthesis protein PslG
VASRPLTVVPIGLCEDYPEESRSMEEVRGDIELLKRAGVTVLRVSIGWDGVEPERDRYDLTFWDAFVAAMDRAGIRLIPYVAYTPRWSSTGQADFWKRPPVDLREFTKVMALLAGRYRNSIRSWEIWNEPDNRDFWAGSAAEYAQLLAAGATGVRSAAPAARVVFGGVAGRPEFAAAVLARPEIGALVDIVNVHAYFETWNPEPIETLPAYLASFTAVLSRPRGPPRPLWLAEVGYSDYRRADVVTTGDRALFPYEHTPDFQAVAAIRTITLALTRPEVALVAWYEIKDPAPSAPMIGDDNNRHLGVLYSDRRPKPALAALAFANRLFGAGISPVDDRLQVFRSAGSDLEAHAFLTAGGRVAIVAWLPTRTATAREVVAFELPVTATGPVRRYDAQGIERARFDAQPGRGAGTIRVEGVAVERGTVAVLEVPIARTLRIDTDS